MKVTAQECSPELLRIKLKMPDTYDKIVVAMEVNWEGINDHELHCL